MAENITESEKEIIINTLCGKKVLIGKSFVQFIISYRYPDLYLVGDKGNQFRISFKTQKEDSI